MCDSDNLSVCERLLLAHALLLGSKETVVPKSATNHRFQEHSQSPCLPSSYATCKAEKGRGEIPHQQGEVWQHKKSEAG